MTDDPEKTWGGKYGATPDDISHKLNATIDFDLRLWRHDIEASKAHAEMLIKQRIIPQTDGQAIQGGLEQIEREIEAGQMMFRRDLGDIHRNIEFRLKEIIGEWADKLHAARSRHDQSVTATRLWTRDAINDIVARIKNLQQILQDLSTQHKDDIMPGHAHSQPTQATTLGLYFDAFNKMLERDKARFQDCYKRVNESPLGASQLGGSTLPVDKEFTALKLGFTKPMDNSIDAVSARDFINEFLFACAQLGVHLSRLAEDLSVWSTPYYSFVAFQDEWQSHAGYLPHQKNPISAEVVRAKVGRLSGNLVQMLTVMKGLPMAYAQDLNEDKIALFNSYDTTMFAIEGMRGMLSGATFNTARMLKTTEISHIRAHALSELLVMHAGKSVHQANDIASLIVKIAQEKKCRLEDLSLIDLQSVEPKISDTIYAAMKLPKKAEANPAPAGSSLPPESDDAPESGSSDS